MKKREAKPGVAPALPGDVEVSLIPNNKLLHLYAAMLKCRMIANAVANGATGRRQRPLLLSEAITAGVTIDLLASDAISPVPSDLTPCALKGAALKTLLRWWSNPSTRVPRVFARANVIPPSPSTAARLEAALRLAAHFRSTKSGSVVVFLDGPDAPRSRLAASPALPPKLLRSYLRQAARERLPVLFVRQSDEDSNDSLDLSGQCGVPGMAVDCDDVVAVYRVASEALSHARRGNGPTLIDAKPWRPKGRLRKTREVRDSIRKMELYLAGKGLAFRSVKDRIAKEFPAQPAGARKAFAGTGKTKYSASERRVPIVPSP
jgi:pyruvate dehydrogenase E1 component alpha subunit